MKKNNKQTNRTSGGFTEIDFYEMLKQFLYFESHSSESCFVNSYKAWATLTCTDNVFILKSQRDFAKNHQSFAPTYTNHNKPLAHNSERCQHVLKTLSVENERGGSQKET